MIVNEVITEKLQQQGNFLEILEQFVRFAAKYLEIDQLPKLVPTLKVDSPDQPTFGELSQRKQEIVFAVENRQPMDILRTLAHELVHWRQHLKNELDDHTGETGSPTENEANSEAGKMLRLFAKQHPEYLEHPAVDLVAENFADGKNPGRKGLSRRVGIPKKATLAQLEKIAKNSTGERRRMAQWQLNMRRGRARKGLDEASTTLQQSRATSQTMKTARNIDYSPALQKNVEAVILAAHQKLQLPHDLNWMNLPPLDGLVGMNIFTDENLRKIWAYHRDPDQYIGTMADKSKLASLAFLIKGPVGAVVMVATPDYNMRIPRKFEMSAAYINLSDGTLETVRDVTKTKILPVVKAATGKVNVRSGEILVADIRQKHTGKISQRQQRSQAAKQDTESTAVAYKKIYRLVPGILQQVEADIMGVVQSLIKNKSYERAKQKIERLDTIRNLEDNITADSSNYYLMRSNDLALYMTASHLFPEQTGEITRSYGGYGVEDHQGVDRVVALIANNDRPTLSMFLAFFKRALLLI